MPRKQGVIAFDIDGVLADFTSGFTRRAALLGIVDHEWSGYEQPGWNFDFHVDPVWESIDADPRFWLDLKPLTYPVEVELLNETAERHSIVYATNRRDAERQTVQWLERYGFPEGPVFFLKDKVALYTSLGDQLLAAIDDKPDTVVAARASGVPMYVRTWPYNANLTALSATSVVEFLDLVKRTGRA